MPHLLDGQLAIPFGGRSPRARSASLSGAQVAVTRAGSQKARMLRTYLQYGALSDLQMADRVGLPESRISARRSLLIAQRLVKYADADIKGPTGATNCLWTLTPYGQQVARDLERAAVR